MRPASARLLRTALALTVSAVFIVAPVRPVAHAQTADDVQRAEAERDAALRRAAQGGDDRDAAVAALRASDVQSLLQVIGTGSCVLSGQVEPFIWLIARMVERRDAVEGA